MKNIDELVSNILAWAKEQKDVEAIGYVGSWARGTAKDDSDLDLMIISNEPDRYFKDDNWMSCFGVVKKIKNEDWGLVKTRRVNYTNDMEIEFNITNSYWAKTNPVEEGTVRPISEGLKIIYDPKYLLQELQVAVRRISTKENFIKNVNK
jgi:predicted nucleotidyltransferase